MPLYVHVDCGIRDLPSLLRTYEATYNNELSEDFKFVELISEIKGVGEKANLMAEVVANIRSKKTNTIWMAPADLVSEHDIDGYLLSERKEAPIRYDITLEKFLIDNSLKQEEIEEKNFCSKYIRLIDENGNLIDRWSALRCLYAEVSLDGNSYLLTEGKWYRIDDDFVSKIENQYQSIIDAGLKLPEWNESSEKEYDYNTKVCKGSQNYYLMDRELIHWPSGRNKIEFCDILDFPGKKLIHVKNFSSSACLSHLFQQALVSAEYFLSDEGFRKLVNDKIDGHGISIPEKASDLDPAEWEVIFGIGTKYPTQPLDIPFFSKVVMVHAARTLRNYKFQVSKQKIIKNSIA